MYNMSKLFNSDDDDLGYLDDSIHINWKKFLPAVIIAAVAVIALIIVLIVSLGHRGKKYLQMHLQLKRLHLSVKQMPMAIIL